MKVNIETYLLEEEEEKKGESEYDKEHLEQLKKAGFDAIVSTEEEEDVDKKEELIIPFQAVDKISRVIQEFYDVSYKVENFTSYVPIQVASLIALCKERGYFKELEIRNNIATPNALMGEFVVMGESKKTNYIIARWSVAPLTSFDDMAKIAHDKFKKRLKSKIEEAIGDKERDLTRLDNIAENYFKGEYIGYYL